MLFISRPSFSLCSSLSAAQGRVSLGTEEPELAVTTMSNPSNESEARLLRNIGAEGFEEL